VGAERVTPMRADWNRRAFHFLRRVTASLWIGLLILNIQLAWRAQNRPDVLYQRAQQTRTLLIGTDPSYPPFAAFVGQGYAGLDIDLGEAIAARMGLRAQFVPMGVDGLYDSLHTDQIDVLISALPFDPSRTGEVIYLHPYLDAGYFLVSVGGAAQTMPDLDGKTIAVEYGSVGDEQARRWARRLAALNIQHYGSREEALVAVRDGKAAAALVDYVSALLWLRENREAGLQVAEKPVWSQPYSIAIKITSYRLAAAVNGAYETLRADGTLSQIIDKWLR